MPPRSTLKTSLRAIDRAFADIERLFAGLAKRVRFAERMARRKVKATAKATRRRPESPKRRAQRKLHGSYIGHLRHLKPAQKARVKAVMAKRGYEAAIGVARKLAG